MEWEKIQANAFAHYCMYGNIFIYMDAFAYMQIYLHVCKYTLLLYLIRDSYPQYIKNLTTQQQHYSQLRTGQRQTQVRTGRTFLQ
jgi:hypothetical protein